MFSARKVECLLLTSLSSLTRSLRARYRPVRQPTPDLFPILRERSVALNSRRYLASSPASRGATGCDAAAEVALGIVGKGNEGDEGDESDEGDEGNEAVKMR
jgi:hypothetical protein